MTPKKRVNSRDKGGRGERQAKVLLQDWWGVEFARTPGSGAFSTITGMTDYAGDVRPVDSNEWFPFSVEVKNAEGWLIEDMIKSDKGPLWKYWKQCRTQAEMEEKVPLLMFTRNRQPWWYLTVAEPFNEDRPLAQILLDKIIPGQKFYFQNFVFTRPLIVGLAVDLQRTDKKDLLCLKTR